MFTIRIKELNAQTTLGVYDWEKTSKRPVMLHIELQVDAMAAGKSDDMKDSVDYDLIEKSVLALLENGSYNLLEKLVAEIGALILSLDPRIVQARVEADKPGALKHAKSVSVSATLNRT